MVPIRLHPAAAKELETAFDWYFERNPKVAGYFLHQLDHAISRIADSPITWPTYYFGTRRYIFSQFPFQIIYREREDVIEIIAIAHGRRRPGYWKERL